MKNGAGVLTLTRTVALIVVTIFCGMACDDPPSGPGIVIDKPVIEPAPSHQAVDVSNSPILIWPSANTFDQTARYELYLDTVNPPTLYAVNITDTVFEPDLLEPGWTYYWQVVTKGVRRGFPVSPLWSFTTRSVTYPVAVGNRWDYEIAFWYENVQPKSLLADFDDTLLMHVEVSIDDFVGGGEGPGRYRFRSDNGGGGGEREFHYYEQREDGLYLMATQGAGSGRIFPKLGRGISYGFAEREFNSINDLLAFLEFSIPGLLAAGSNDLYPQKCFEYPLRVGNQWAYLEQEPGFLSIDRRVIDWQSIEIPPGRFDCFVIHHLYDLAGDGTWDENIEVVDFVAYEGLVKRKTIVRDVIIRDWGHGGPGGAGTADVVSEAILTDFQLENR